MNNALELFHPLEIRHIPLRCKPRRNNKKSALRNPSIFSLNMPFPFLSIELRANDDRFKRALFAEIQHLITMVKVGAELLVVWVVGRPIPVFVYFRPTEFVLWDFRVDACAGVAVPTEYLY